jgi:hypothetical protein
MGSRQHHSTRTTKSLRAIGQAVPGQELPLCTLLSRIIRDRRKARQCGTWLLGDSDGYVYLLSDTSVDAVYILDRLQKMVVGLYTVPVPSPEVLRDDLIQHFVDVGYIAHSSLCELVET